MHISHTDDAEVLKTHKNSVCIKYYTVGIKEFDP